MEYGEYEIVIHTLEYLKFNPLVLIKYEVGFWIGDRLIFVIRFNYHSANELRAKFRAERLLIKYLNSNSIVRFWWRLTKKIIVV